MTWFFFFFVVVGGGFVSGFLLAFFGFWCVLVWLFYCDVFYGVVLLLLCIYFCVIVFEVLFMFSRFRGFFWLC